MSPEEMELRFVEVLREHIIEYKFCDEAVIGDNRSYIQLYQC